LSPRLLFKQRSQQQRSLLILLQKRIKLRKRRRMKRPRTMRTSPRKVDFLCFDHDVFDITSKLTLNGSV
jgi:hypothetical protein